MKHWNTKTVINKSLHPNRLNLVILSNHPRLCITSTGKPILHQYRPSNRHWHQWCGSHSARLSGLASDIDVIRVNIKNLVGARAQVETLITVKGFPWRRPYTKTTIDTNHRRPSQKMVSLASIQAWPWSTPTTTRKLGRYREPRQRTLWHWLLIIT